MTEKEMSERMASAVEHGDTSTTAILERMLRQQNA
jgi:hypothetical protein